MTDIVSRSKRSEMMSRIRSKDTKPEMAVRSWLHRHGYRFRINRKDLPGTPDIVLPKYRTVIFVNGCFWHRHNCKLAYNPKSNVKVWEKKFRDNVSRDETVRGQCRNQGWYTLNVWECEIRDEHFSRRLQKELSQREAVVGK